jgi:hypothetical protein
MERIFRGKGEHRMKKVNFDSPDTAARDKEATGRKEYKPPCVTVYGDILEVTRAEGSSVFDGLLSSGPAAPIRQTPFP